MTEQRFSEHVIKSIKLKDFDGAIFYSMFDSDKLGLISPGYFHRERYSEIPSNWFPSENRSPDSWSLLCYTTGLFKKTKHVYLERNGKYLSLLWPQEEEDLYTAFELGMEYYKTVSVVEKDKKKRDELEKLHWL